MDECDTEEYGTLDSSEKPIVILEDRWWPQAANQEGDNTKKVKPFHIWKQRSERRPVGVSVRGVGGVLRLGRDAWPIAQ